MTDDAFDSPPPSKTRRKQEAQACQDLGARLVQLSEERLGTLGLDEDLYRAVQEARRLRAHEARRRQLQYIGKLMRRIDAAPILAQLDADGHAAQAQAARQHLIERWRERLLTDEAALARFLADYPQAQSQPLRTLIRNAQKEQREQRPPKSSRALFRALRDIIDSGPTPD